VIGADWGLANHSSRLRVLVQDDSGPSRNSTHVFENEDLSAGKSRLEADFGSIRLRGKVLKRIFVNLMVLAIMMPMVNCLVGCSGDDDPPDLRQRQLEALSAPTAAAPG